MKIEVFNPDGELLHERESQWEPFEQGIYGDWIGDDETGWWERLGTTRGEQLLVWPAGGSGQVGAVHVDGVAVDIGSRPLWHAAGDTVSLMRNVEEHWTGDPAKARKRLPVEA